MLKKVDCSEICVRFDYGSRNAMSSVRLLMDTNFWIPVEIKRVFLGNTEWYVKDEARGYAVIR